jgi:hypothetical protein
VGRFVGRLVGILIGRLVEGLLVVTYFCGDMVGSAVDGFFVVGGGVVIIRYGGMSKENK